MTITYTLGNNLYINTTNRCTNDCSFCLRNLGDGVGDADTLWLEKEPTREEIIDDIKKRDLSKYSEIVFCGYGEPTERLEDILWIAGEIKKITATPIRVDTNGHSDLLYNKNTAPMFNGLIDKISISLNAPTSKDYDALCKPIFGEKTFEGILNFSKNIKEYVPDVTLSIVGGTTDEEACREIANMLNIPLRVR